MSNAPINNIAANPKPATVSRIFGQVKVLFLIKVESAGLLDNTGDETGVASNLAGAGGARGL